MEHNNFGHLQNQKRATEHIPIRWVAFNTFEHLILWMHPCKPILVDNTLSFDFSMKSERKSFRL